MYGLAYRVKYKKGLGMIDNKATNVAEPTANAENETTETESTVTENSEPTIDQLKSTSERLLAESKKNREAALKYKKELEALRQKQATEQGQFKDLYESERQKNEALSKQVMRGDIDFALKTEGQKLGCRRPELLLKLGNPDLLQYDADSRQVSGVREFLEEIKRDFPEMFQAAKTTVINPTTPNGVAREIKIDASAYAKLSSKDKREAMKVALSKK